MERVTAKVITRSQGLRLVEWLDGDKPKRAWVTPDMVVDDTGKLATIEHPAGGIPYGVDWSEFTSGQVKTDLIETRLHQAGIWTVEDLQQQVKVAQGIIQAAAGDVLQELLVNARAHQKDARNMESNNYG